MLLSNAAKYKNCYNFEKNLIKRLRKKVNDLKTELWYTTFSLWACFGFIELSIAA